MITANDHIGHVPEISGSPQAYRDQLHGAMIAAAWCVLNAYDDTPANDTPDDMLNWRAQNYRHESNGAFALVL